MRRFVEDFLTVSTQRLNPDIAKYSRRQSYRKRVPVELWKMARHWEGADIHQSFDLVCAEYRDQVVERARGVSDRVQGCQRVFDAALRRFAAGHRRCRHPAREIPSAGLAARALRQLVQ